MKKTPKNLVQRKKFWAYRNDGSASEAEGTGKDLFKQYFTNNKHYQAKPLSWPFNGPSVIQLRPLEVV